MKNPFDLKFETRKTITVWEELSNQELLVKLPDGKVIHYATKNGYPYEERKPKEYESEKDFNEKTNMQLNWYELIEKTRVDIFAVEAIYNNFPEGTEVRIMEF